MAEADRVASFHLYLGVVGLAAAACSTSSLTTYTMQPPVSRFVPLGLTVLSQLALLLGLGLWPHEKQSQAGDLASAVHQVRMHNNRPSVNESVLVAAIGSVLILAGMVGLGFRQSKDWTMGWVMPLVLATGWLLVSLGSSTHHESISSMEPYRLIWLMLGSALIVVSVLSLPQQLMNRRKFPGVGYVGPLHVLGWILFLIGYAHVSTFELEP